ncbi:hypothetical protein [Halomonas sp. I5-271120]|uniref:hypothetical protein n=1 Tax=Halomonas sp. I5-271120 TaxID=3061632 RepID=UPI00271500B6|nr:hypothetical protein [Halomonas sp. I5-271120]
MKRVKGLMTVLMATSIVSGQAMAETTDFEKTAAKLMESGSSFFDGMSDANGNLTQKAEKAMEKLGIDESTFNEKIESFSEKAGSAFEKVGSSLKDEGASFIDGDKPSWSDMSSNSDLLEQGVESVKDGVEFIRNQ